MKDCNKICQRQNTNSAQQWCTKLTQFYLMVICALVTFDCIETHRPTIKP